MGWQASEKKTGKIMKVLRRMEKQLSQEYAQYLRALIEEAGRVDAGRQVFGATKHQYRLGPVLTLEEVRRAEAERHMKFPEEYVFYLTQVGNGGAGPYYGLYSLETVMQANSNPCLGQSFEQTVTPTITGEQWREHMRRLEMLEESAETKTDYKTYWERLYSGMVSVGTQGCTYDHMLMLTGKYAGRIVYMDWNELPDNPPFDTGMTFLEWMEGFFADILEGCNMESYGYRLRKTQEQVLEQYLSCHTTAAKRTLLDSLFRLREIGTQATDFLEELALADEEVADICCALLVQKEQERGLAVFEKMLAQRMIPAVCRSIRYLRRLPREVHSRMYRQVLQVLGEIHTKEGISVYYFLIECEQFRAGDIAEYVRCMEDKELLKAGIYTMGKAQDALDYVELFIQWMQSEDSNIAHTALQAMAHQKHEKLMPVYRWMQKKYETNSVMQRNLRIAMEHAE